MEFTLEQSRRQFYELLMGIDCGIIKSCDGFLVREPMIPFLKHYFTYAYMDEQGIKWFFVTTSSIGKVRLMNQHELLELAIKFRFSFEKNLPFIGSETQRQLAFQRGLSCLGKSYKWIGRNCENLMNYIQTGKSKSIQTRSIAGGTTLVGGLMMSSKSKGVKYAGAVLVVVGLGSLLIDLFKEDKF